MAEDDRILAGIAPSPARRAFATGVLGGLGVLLELLAFLRSPASIPLQLLLVGLGAAALILCVRLYAATGRSLILTSAGLADSDGRELAAMDEITKVERGVFAFKPSNGFVLHLKTRRPGAWAPGLWWRMGRRIGVGGVISGAEGRAMADLISAAIAGRDR